MLIAVRLESNPHTVRLQEEESISDAGTCLASDVGIQFLLVVSFYFFIHRLISAVADWMFTILRHVMWP